MATPREHIEEIRRKKFSIGGEPNPLTEDLHQAVKNLSAELYTKDVHFFMELIQNAEDNEYLEGVDPSLEFVITSRDITCTGASATLLMFNNERGFSAKNIESICSVGRSTKKGNRKQGGYIGEKGIGFKSVFLITAQPYIFSNGYQIRFKEGPSMQCNVGYIVPEWVEENPTLSVIKEIYGSSSVLPTTTIVLPLKSDKVKPVKHQLSCIHPEVLLFLSKLKHLSIREDNEDPKLNTVNAISISSEVNFVTRKNIDAESYILHLSAGENGDDQDRECSYHMWRQRFRVREENKVERRMEIDEWMITLAFPNGERLHRGANSPGIYAFLPTEMVTNFPFIIQADFLLASSRETILLDNKWNQGILDCVPTAFVNAFTSLVKFIEDAPVSILPRMFGFLPVNSSSYVTLNAVRESIKAKLVDQSILPSESYTKQKFFHKPREVGRLMPAFWNILNKASGQGVSLHCISSHGTYILSSSFDKKKYNHILNFLGVEYVDAEWYTKCIQSSNIVLGVSEDVYLALLLFIAEKWKSFQTTDIKNIPLLKNAGVDGNVSLCSINYVSQMTSERILVSSESHSISWLIDWNREFRCAADRFFLPKSTQEAMWSSSKRQTIIEWLVKEVNIKSVDVHEYAVLLIKSLSNDRKLVVAYAHFIYHSHAKLYLSGRQVADLCKIMPLVDNYGRLFTQRSGVLVPAIGSKWIELIGSNPWRKEGYVELGEDYQYLGSYAGVFTPQNELVTFLKTYVGASDVPDLSPPNAVIPAMYSLLTKQNTFLLLEWIRNLKRKGVRMPKKFLRSIKKGSWLKISLSGSPGCRPPSQSFLLTSSWGDHLQNGAVLVDIPLIDQRFYGDEIDDYREELRTAGVMLEFGEACQYIGNHLMSLAASSTLTKGNVLSILNFIKFLRDKLLPVDNFINSIKDRRWLRTSQGVRAPIESVLFDLEWRAASQISDIPFLDQEYYGEGIHSFKTELELLGVVIGFNQSYYLVVENLKSQTCLTSVTAEAILLILACIRHVRSVGKVVSAVKAKKCIKTNMGYKSPAECFLFDPEWGCLLRVFNCFPLIDESFYGSSMLLSYTNELKQLGVVVYFEEAAQSFASVFRQQASLSAIRKDNVLSLLACYRKISGNFLFPQDLTNCIRDEKWLRSRLGDYRAPNDCILFGPNWKSISLISLLPFIDDSENHYGKGIHAYKVELQSMGVVVDFKEGAKFVASALFLPRSPSTITPASVYSLLECIRNIPQEQNESLLAVFSKKVAQKWLKTHFGYRSPDECLLFSSELDSFLHREDGPFIDEEFYGSMITSYRKELNNIGVTVDIRKGCVLLASYLECHSNFTTISRIYNFLSEFNWKPNEEDTKKVWIPNGSDDGEWVSPEECVLYDKDGLFGLHLNVLEKCYEKKLLNFFSKVLEVIPSPSVDAYCKLWKRWEGSEHFLSLTECCAFWQFVVKSWNSKTEKTFSENLSKLPVNSVSAGIHLVDKRDVFIADDLCLKDLFEQSSSQPLFVWYPQSSLKSLPRTKLLEIYSEIGAQTLSKFVQKEKLSRIDGGGLKQVNPREVFIGRGLFRLILAFLADVSLDMEAQKRHEAVRHLLNVTVFETLEPITMVYSLSLSSGKVLNVKATRMIRWERENSKFFMQKMDRSIGHKHIMEYATYFSEVVSEGLLWDKEDHVHQLAELIKLGFLVEFDEDAIKFLLKTKNLQIFAEDEDFLSSAFPLN